MINFDEELGISPHPYLLSQEFSDHDSLDLHGPKLTAGMIHIPKSFSDPQAAEKETI